MMMVTKLKPLTYAILGLSLIALGIASYFGVPMLIRKIVYWKLTIAPNSEALTLWKDIPVPIYDNYYFFNVTNAEDVERFGAKPILREVGPFVYRLYMNKTGIIFHDNGTVTFREKKTWIFQADKSVADERQVLTTLNGPLALTLTLIQHASPAVRTIVSLALEAVTEGFFIKRSVKQLLFEGYPDTLTTFAPLLNPEITSFSTGRFAWLIGKNATDDGVYNVYTGSNGIDKLNFIDRYENKTELPYWLGAQCNNLTEATNGEMHPPLKGHVKSVKLFHPDLCRVVDLDYNKTFESPMTDGLVAKRFILNENSFKNLTDYPPNSCYDTKLFYPAPPPSASSPLQARLRSIFNLRRTAHAEAFSQPIRFPSGVFDISKCKFGMPIVISSPHFLNGDPFYRTTVYGLKPNATKHTTYLDMEPETGTTIALAARIQINVAINKGPGFRYRNIPNIVFPILWQEMKMDVTSDIADQLWLAQNMPGILSAVTSYSFTIIGCLLTLAAMIIPTIKLFQNRTAKPPARKVSTQDDNKNILTRQTSFDTQLGVDNPVTITRD
ncbi:Scavenger receptor class B member 1 [Halotydeus destructor]|nr:Scavenger receptor class B member 1 [Halotydeus destructor]